VLLVDVVLSDVVVLLVDVVLSDVVVLLVDVMLFEKKNDTFFHNMSNLHHYTDYDE